MVQCGTAWTGAGGRAPEAGDGRTARLVSRSADRTDWLFQQTGARPAQCPPAGGWRRPLASHPGDPAGSGIETTDRPGGADPGRFCGRCRSGRRLRISRPVAGGSGRRTFVRGCGAGGRPNRRGFPQSRAVAGLGGIGGGHQCPLCQGNGRQTLGTQWPQPVGAG